MKWASLTYHLAIAGVVFTVEASSCFATSATDLFNFKKSVENTKSKVSHLYKASNEKRGNEKGETDTPPKGSCKIRDNPESFNENPDDFVYPKKNEPRKRPYIQEFTEDGIPIIISPTSIDPNDYILFDETRKKRAKSERIKREARMADDEDEELDILKMMNGGEQDHHHHRPKPEEFEWDEEKIAKASDEAANAVLEALGFGKGAGKYWPDGPPSTANLIPIAKVRIPFVRRPTL